MIKESCRYKKIKEFIKELNLSEKEYMYKKLHENILDEKIQIVNFTINGKKIVNS